MFLMFQMLALDVPIKTLIKMVVFYGGSMYMQNVSRGVVEKRGER